MIPLVNKNASKRTPEGFNACVKKIGCEPEAIEAVIAVEAAGRGWDRQGRLRMLFEPHVFYRVLAKNDKDDLETAVASGVAYPSWGQRPYPKDSYPRLERARQINEELALRGASWGLPQILGENYDLAGYKSAVDMVTDFLGGEDAQLTALSSFVVAKNLDGALRDKQWAVFARGYNGAAYAKNGYDVAISVAYGKAKRRTSLGKAATTTAAASTVGAPVGGAAQSQTGGDMTDTGLTVFGLLALGIGAWIFKKWNADRPVISDWTPKPKRDVASEVGKTPAPDKALTDLLAAQTEVTDLRTRLGAANDKLVAARESMHAEIEAMRQAYVVSGGELGRALEELRGVVEGTAQ